MQKISAVMLSFHRPGNIKPILAELEKNDLIDEIIVWHCNPAFGLDLGLNSKKTKIINTDNRYGTFSRWYASITAKNDVIYMQDDDLIVPNELINDLYSKWQKEPDILHGYYGRNFSLNREYVAGDCYGKTDLVLTPSVFFQKKYAQGIIDFIPKFDKEIFEIGKRRCEDILFNFYVMSQSNKKNFSHKPCGEIKKLNEDNALSHHPDHIPERTKVLRYCLKNMIPANLSKRSAIENLNSFVRAGFRMPGFKYLIYSFLGIINIVGLYLAFTFSIFTAFIIIFCFSALFMLISEAYFRIQHNVDRRYKSLAANQRIIEKETRSNSEKLGKILQKNNLFYWTYVREKRAEKLSKLVPDIFLRKKILYVGARPDRNEFLNDFLQNGCEVTILEIYRPNVEYFNKQKLCKVIEGDICNFSPTENYDIVFWWHGPEHVRLEKIPVTLKKIESYAKCVVLACPWGTVEQSKKLEEENQFEKHVSSFDVGYFEQFGFKTDYFGAKDNPGSNILSVRRLK